ncbi:MAG: helix-turn-helix domain-containing protein [Sphingomonadales bacterium]|nr:ATP-binding protein [Sphingomonadales bacterium]
MNPVLRKYLKDGEGTTLDFKQSVSSAAKIAKTMVSFANTKGGVLLMGVRDNKTICGVRSEDEKYMLDLAAHFFCRPELDIEIIEHESEGKTLLEVKVPNGSDKPYYAKDEEGKWWVYVRANDKSLLASKTTVDFLKRQQHNLETAVPMGHIERGILDYVSKNERITLQQVCKMFNISRRRASRTLVNLMSLNVLRSHTTEKTEYYTGV